MTPKRRFAISTLILFGYALILAFVVTLCLFFTYGLHHLHATTQDLYVHPFTVCNAAASMRGTMFQLRNHMLQIVLLGNQDDNIQTLELTSKGYIRQIRTDLEIIKSNFLGDMSKVRQLEQRLIEWYQIQNKILDAARQGNFGQAEVLVRTEGTPKFNESIPLVDYIQRYAKQRAALFVLHAEEDAQKMIQQSYLLTGLLIGLIVATAAFIMWRVHFLQAELDRQATTDFLTGVPNRRQLIFLAEQELRRVQRYQGTFSLAILDLDFFKRINDSRGHKAGDLVLKALCAVCTQKLRDSDTLGRIGGEEFAILLPNTKLSESLQVMERVRRAIEQHEIVVDEQGPVRVTASIGLTSFKTTHKSLTDLMHEADEALYRAKQGGRNQVICAQAEAHS